MKFVRLLLLALLSLSLVQCRLSSSSGDGTSTEHGRRPTNEPEEIVGYAIDSGKITSHKRGNQIIIVGENTAVSGKPELGIFGISQYQLDLMHFGGGGETTLPAGSRLASAQADHNGAFEVQVPEGSYDALVVAITDNNSVFVAKSGETPLAATQSMHQVGVATFNDLLAEDHVQGLLGKILEIKPDSGKPDVFGWMNVLVEDAEEVSRRYPNLNLRSNKIWIMLCKKLDENPCLHFNEVGAFPRLPTLDAKLLAFDTTVVGQYVRLSGYVNSWATQMNGYRIIAYDAKFEDFVFNGNVVEVKDDSLVSRMLKVELSPQQKLKLQQDSPTVVLRGEPAYIWVYACVCKTFTAGVCTEFDHAQAGGTASTCSTYLSQGHLTHNDLQETLPLSQMGVGSALRIRYRPTPYLNGQRLLGNKISSQE